MSQEKLGDELGLTFQQVQKYEKGTNSLSASRIPRVCHVLGISLEQLFFGTMGEYKLVDFAQLSSPAIRLAGHIDKLDNNVAARLRGLVDALIPSEEGEGAQA
jgi:transcriptional regulator with XRE-family HTH domain